MFSPKGDNEDIHTYTYIHQFCEHNLKIDLRQIDYTGEHVKQELKTCLH